MNINLAMTDELHSTIKRHKGKESTTAFINSVLTQHFVSQGITVGAYPSGQKVKQHELKALLSVIVDQPGCKELYIMEALSWSRQNLRTRLNELMRKKIVRKGSDGKANRWYPKDANQ